VKVKVKRESNKRQTFAWFAPSIDFVLVRIQQFKEGEEQGDIRLSSYSRQ
jgi:carbamoylphosphate synthase large subunit